MPSNERCNRRTYLNVETVLLSFLDISDLKCVGFGFVPECDMFHELDILEHDPTLLLLLEGVRAVIVYQRPSRQDKPTVLVVGETEPGLELGSLRHPRRFDHVRVGRRVVIVVGRGAVPPILGVRDLAHLGQLALGTSQGIAEWWDS